MPDSRIMRRPGGIHGIGPGILWFVATSLLSGKPRSIADDVGRVVELMNPPPRVEGIHLVPSRGAFALVANHFQHGGWWVGWVAAAITQAVSRARDPGAGDLHWVVLSEWRWFEFAGRWIPNPISSILFPRAARVWGLISMPSRPSDVAGRARALRRVLARVRGENGQPSAREADPVGLFPEGRASVELSEALPGTGALLARVSGGGVPLLPVGVYQEGEGLVVRIGAPFHLADAPPGRHTDVDSWAREQVMVAIGRLLPPYLWGAYAGAIDRDVSGHSTP